MNVLKENIRLCLASRRAQGSGEERSGEGFRVSVQREIHRHAQAGGLRQVFRTREEVRELKHLHPVRDPKPGLTHRPTPITTAICILDVGK